MRGAEEAAERRMTVQLSPAEAKAAKRFARPTLQRRLQGNGMNRWDARRVIYGGHPLRGRGWWRR